MNSTCEVVAAPCSARSRFRAKRECTTTARERASELGSQVGSIVLPLDGLLGGVAGERLGVHLWLGGIGLPRPDPLLLSSLCAPVPPGPPTIG